MELIGRHAARPVPDPRTARRGRHGRGLPGARHEADRNVAIKVLPARFARPRAARPLRARGAGRRRALAPEHPRHLMTSGDAAGVPTRHGAARRRTLRDRLARRAARRARPSSTRGQIAPAWRPRTTAASSTAISSPRTCSSPRRAASRSSTSASRGDAGAGFAGGARVATPRTAAGMVLGTVGYMAPGAGARGRPRPARGPLRVRRRPLRDADRPSGVPARHPG